MIDLRQINVPSAPMRSSFDENSDLISESLFGEQFQVMKTKNKWCYGINQIDRYSGWIEQKKLIPANKHTHIINVPRSLIISEPNVKSNIIQYLPFMSLINVIKQDNDWGVIKINNKFGYINKKHYVAKNYIDNDWVKYAVSLLNTPYHYGGRDSIALDCSALLQLSLRFSGIYLERDTKDQIKNKLLKDTKISKIKRGSIIFWKNHVAIAINNSEIIHANGYHMKTCIENFNIANERIEKTNGKILKIKYINLLK